jgi:hypothetical protein
MRLRAATLCAVGALLAAGLTALPAAGAAPAARTAAAQPARPLPPQLLGRPGLPAAGPCPPEGTLLPRARPQFSVSGRRSGHGPDRVAGCLFRVVARPGATISGRVTDARGRPAAQVTIVAVDQSGDGDAACSRPNGDFRISRLPAAQYTVTFFASTYCRTKGNWAPQYYPDQANPANAVPVSVRAGQHVSRINAALRPGATLTGQVTSRTGRPLRGICVGLSSPGSAAGYAQLDELGTATRTGRHGVYRITGLAAGRYTVQFNGCFSARYANQWFGSRPRAPLGAVVDIGGGQTVAGVNAVMHPGGNIFSIMRTSTGQHVTDCALVTSVRTGVKFLAAGYYTYTFAGLAPGGYRVEFYTCFQGNYAAQWFNRRSSARTATVVRVRAGATSRVYSALRPGSRISGRLTSQATGRPLPNFCVYASTASGAFFGSGFSGGDGHYVVTGLNAGTYSLQFYNCGAGSAADVAPAARVHVTPPRMVSGVDVTTPVGASVSGQVQVRTAAAAGPGGVCVWAFPVTAGGLKTFVKTGYSGRYTLPNLHPGRYKIFFDTGMYCDNGFAPVVSRWYRAAAVRSAAVAVTVRAGRDTAGIGARLPVTGGLSGQVTAAASGAPLTGVCVRALPRAAGRPVSFTVSSSGRYSLIGLSPGRYAVQFSAGCGASGYATQWWHHAPSATGATVIIVRADAVRAGIDAQLARRR